jgi:hypothetical protein
MGFDGETRFEHAAASAVQPLEFTMKPTAKNDADNAAQLVREVVYALKGSPLPRRKGKSGNRKRAIHGIIGEVLRKPGYCDHIPAPHPPRVLFGKTLDELRGLERRIARQAAKQVEYAQYGTGLRRRRQRSTVPTLLVAIASYPGPPDDSAEYLAWRQRVVEWAQAEYGARIESIVEHTDEPQGHVHVLVTNQGKPVKPLHSGHRAAAQAGAQGATRKAIAEAYRDGCRRFQDRFHRLVGDPCGLSRISSNPQPRRSWKEYVGDQVRKSVREEHEALLKQAEEDRRAAAQERVEAEAERLALQEHRRRQMEAWDRLVDRWMTNRISNSDAEELVQMHGRTMKELHDTALRRRVNGAPGLPLRAGAQD